MKIYGRYILTAVASALILSSCVYDGIDREDPNGGEGSSVDFVVSIPATSTRAVPEGVNGVEDNRIVALSVLVFDADGSYYDRITFNDPENVPGDRSRKKLNVSLPDGDYQALFVANAEAEIDDFLDAAGGTAAEKTIDKFVDDLELIYTGKWNSKPGTSGYRPFPMSSRPLAFDVPSDVDYEAHPVEMVRALAKINVTSEMETARFDITRIIVTGYADGGVYLVPHVGWRKGASVFDGTAVNFYDGTVDGYNNSQLVYDKTADPSTSEITSGRCIDEIFVFERGGSETGADPVRLLIRANVDFEGTPLTNRWYCVELKKKNPDNGNVPEYVDIIRNFKYNINITEVNTDGWDSGEQALDNPNIGITTDLHALNEEGMDDITYNGEYQLAVDKSVVIMGHNANSKADMRVSTDFNGGWQQTSTLPDWFTMTPEATSSANSSSATRVAFAVTGSNTSGNAYKHTLIYTAGALRKEVTVIQLPSSANVTDNVPLNINRYVGAFWRADQTGERLISVVRPGNNSLDGEWNAYVLDGTDWIVLDTEPTTDPNVGLPEGTNEIDYGNDPDFDLKHSVEGSGTWVSGTMNEENPVIYFRIGLKTKHIPTSSNPARYARILVSYADGAHTQTIYLRQGEDPDYLMRPQDPVNTAGITERTAAVKISPYNLTATTLNAQVNSMDDPTGPNPPRFTEYPTQAGAFFQAAAAQGGGFERTAWEPVAIDIPAYPYYTIPYAEVWSSTYRYLETCPQNYTLTTGSNVDFRRPTDGPIDRGLTNTYAEDVQVSEMRQSLYVDIPDPVITSNISSTESKSDYLIVGYYADGFFDRRAVVTSPTGTAASAVSVDNNDIAYKGVLLYNPFTGAHLFFPSSGYRDGNNGNMDEMTNSGSASRYWSGSKSSNSWSFEYSSRAIRQTAQWYGSAGYSIRCVTGEMPPIQEPEIELSLSSSVMEFDYYGDSFDYNHYISVYTNATDWTVSPADLWDGSLVVDKDAGTIYFRPWSLGWSFPSRYDYLTITAGDKTETIYVKQFADFSNITVPDMTFDADGNDLSGAGYFGNQPLVNPEWWTVTVAPGGEWLTLSAYSGYNEEAFIQAFPAYYEGTEDRSTTVTLEQGSYSGVVSSITTFTITQKGR